MDTPRYLFLDRDGIVNRRIVGGYVSNTNEFIIKTDFLEAMELLAPRFKKIFIITNQQGVGKGLLSLEQVHEVHSFMRQELAKHNVFIDDIYVCPHLAAAHCNCRKPLPGLALRAKEEHPDIDFSRSVMIGDALSDLLFGRNCGMKTVFVNDPQIPITSEISRNADIIVDEMVELVPLNF